MLGSGVPDVGFRVWGLGCGVLFEVLGVDFEVECLRME